MISQELSATLETVKHVNRVRELLQLVVNRLLERALRHDASKLEDPERPVFAEMTALLAGSTYGSPDYHRFLAGMKSALEHHYAHNSHHPEHYPDGIHGMDLLDLIEMLIDWKAATERHRDGSLRSSVELNQGRFGYDDRMKALLLRTAANLGLLDGAAH